MDGGERVDVLNREPLSGTVTPIPSSSFTLLGSGRAAKHLRHYFNLLGISCRCWGRAESRDGDSRLGDSLRSATHVFLLVTDAAIEPLARRAQAMAAELDAAERYWIHCSGSLSTPLAWGCHPLMTFPAERLHGWETYRKMAWVVDSQAPAANLLLPRIPNPVFRIDPNQKALYHALCVLSGNVTTLLWQRMIRGLEEQLRIPRAAALPYLSAVSQSIGNNLEAALTGPLARGDEETLARDLSALAGDPYASLLQAAIRAYRSAGISAGGEALR